MALMNYGAAVALMSAPMRARGARDPLRRGIVHAASRRQPDRSTAFAMRA